MKIERGINQPSNKDKLRKGIVTVGTAAALLAGANNVEANEINLNQEKTTTESQELSSVNPSPESYNAQEKIVSPSFKRRKQARINNPLKSFLEDMQHSENISYQKLELKLSADYDDKLSILLGLEIKLLQLTEESQVYNELRKSHDEIKKQLDSKQKSIVRLQERRGEIQKDANNILQDENLKYIYERAPQLIVKLEDIRKNLINIVNTSDYLKKLQKEFNCNREEAKKHQEVRLNNLKSVTFFFRKSSMIDKDSNKGTESTSAYYSPEWHEICLPYNEEESKVLHFATHELLHSITVGEEGLSAKAKSLLNSSFQENTDYSSKYNEYLASSAERYVRLKLLELELDRLGIKKIGKKITKSGYKKMIDWYNEKKDNNNSYNQDLFHLLETINVKDEAQSRDNLNQLFQEIADNQDTYYHPGWNYDKSENVT